MNASLSEDSVAETALSKKNSDGMKTFSVQNCIENLLIFFSFFIFFCWIERSSLK